MKAFTAYLTESIKTYEFRIRIAGELTEDITNKIKQVLETYKLDSISKPKRLPIHESPEFPSLGPVEVNIIDISLCYPCTDAQVRALIVEGGCAAASCIRVTPTNSPYESAMAGLEQSNLQKSGESVLATPEMLTKKTGELAGDARVGDLMKELAGLRKYEYANAAGGKTPAGKTTNSTPISNTSPMGSVASKFPVTPAGKGR